MAKRRYIPAGLYWDARKGNGGDYRSLPSCKTYRGMGGSPQSCKHCGSLLSPRKAEEPVDATIDDLDFGMFEHGATK